MRRLHERGDTIVEVLIAVGIVSMVLAAAYALTTRNARIAQEVQEQSYAQKLVEEQVEVLGAQGGGILVSDSGRCFVAGGYVDDATDCVRTNGGAEFTLSIDSTSAPIYLVKATWTTLGGSEADVSAYYRAVN